MSRRTSPMVAVMLALVVSLTTLGAVPAEAQSPSAAVVAAKQKPKKPKVKKARVVGQPPRMYVPTSGSYFSYPNKGKKAQGAIRKRVLLTIRSTWGGPRQRGRIATPGNGTIRIATWTFDDWAIARALVAAKKRGVSVQIVGAKAANKGLKPWKYLRKNLGNKIYYKRNPATSELTSFARHCSGSCRGPGGTAHAKYFLFDKVGASKTHYITFNTSMNLTEFARTNQWNHAEVSPSRGVYGDFLTIFRQARLMKGRVNPYHVKRIGSYTNYFFPRPKAKASQDPVMQNLADVQCKGATVGGNAAGRTKIRILQYAIYGDRGVWIAKRLRNLWQRGCDIKIIYSLTTRPVLQILRNGSGRGKIPMRQSVIKDGAGVITSYNHSKWMTVTGRLQSTRANWMSFYGSANWAGLAFGSDEQMQRTYNKDMTLRYNKTFIRTWRQKASNPPPNGRVSPYGRSAGVTFPGVPAKEPQWGKGVYRYMTPQG